MKWKSSEIRFTNRQTHTGHFVCSALCVCAFAIGVRICVNFNLIDTHTLMSRVLLCVCVSVCLTFYVWQLFLRRALFFSFKKKHIKHTIHQ